MLRYTVATEPRVGVFFALFAAVLVLPATYWVFRGEGGVGSILVALLLAGVPTVFVALESARVRARFRPAFQSVLERVAASYDPPAV